LKEEPIGPSSNLRSVIAVTSASGAALLSSFQNIVRKKKPFEGLFTKERLERMLLTKPFLFLLARRPAPFIKMREAMWLSFPKTKSERLWS
jgi:hypothetical protein